MTTVPESTPPPEADDLSRARRRIRWVFVLVWIPGLTYVGACTGGTIQKWSASEGSRARTLVELDDARHWKSEVEDRARKDPTLADDVERARLGLEDLERRLRAGPPPSWTEKYLGILPLGLAGALAGLFMGALLAAAILAPPSAPGDTEPEDDDRSDRWQGGYGGFPG